MEVGLNVKILLLAYEQKAVYFIDSTYVPVAVGDHFCSGLLDIEFLSGQGRAN
jgi:hypothetical protein